MGGLGVAFEEKGCCGGRGSNRNERVLLQQKRRDVFIILK